MTNLIKLADYSGTTITYREVLESLLASIKDDPAEANRPITNIILMSFHRDSYYYGMLNSKNLLGMIGTIEFVKDALLKMASGSDDEE